MVLAAGGGKAGLAAVSLKNKEGGYIMALVKSIPAADTGAGVTCVSATGENFRISQNLVKMEFTLWKVHPNGYEKIATANTPLKLYDRIDWDGTGAKVQGKATSDTTQEPVASDDVGQELSPRRRARAKTTPGAVVQSAGKENEPVTKKRSPRKKAVPVIDEEECEQLHL